MMDGVAFHQSEMQAASVGAFELDPESSDAAMIISLETGLYTMRIRGEDGTTDVALVELYALP